MINIRAGLLRSCNSNEPGAGSGVGAIAAMTQTNKWKRVNETNKRANFVKLMVATDTKKFPYKL